MMVSEKIDIEEDTILVGIGVSPGIAIGTIYLSDRGRRCVIDSSITLEEVEQEIASFQQALQLSRQQLLCVRESAPKKMLKEHLFILDAHLLILEDPMLVEGAITLIRKDLLSAHTAVRRTLDAFRAVFAEVEDAYLRDRISDVDAVADRVLRNLTGETVLLLSDIVNKAIVVAHNLSPADTMQMDRTKICGFVTDVGSRTSHTAILARSLAIPAVVGLETATSIVPSSVSAIIDGSSGTLILNPSEQMFREYLQKKQRYEYHDRELLQLSSLDASTEDGFEVALKANVESPEDTALAQARGARGIGLFRTEYLYFNRSSPPTEEEQFLAYRRIAEKIKPYSVTIRTLDVGGDKLVAGLDLSDEANPVLGMRAIRFSLQEGTLFRVQLRAILRASVFGKIRILFPMVTGLAELRACKAFLRDVQRELEQDNIAYDPQISVGVMIETPAAVLVASLLAQECDFFSIGTNDLIQYCLAVDRGNEHVAYLYEPLHPAILRALKMVCDGASSAGIPVSMCGEMAAEPLYSPVLIALGIDEFSMNAQDIPVVKKALRQLSRATSRDLLLRLLLLPTGQEIKSCLEEYLEEHCPGVLESFPLL